MKKTYYSIIILFISITFSSSSNANYAHDKYILGIKDKLTRFSTMALNPLNITAGIEQGVFIEVTKDGALFSINAEKPIKNVILYKNTKRLLQLANPYRPFLNTFNKNIKLAKIKIIFFINNKNKADVKSIKLVELKNVIPKNL